MAGYKIRLKGWRVTLDGRLVRDVRRLDVSARLKQRSSKRVRVAKRTAATVPGVRR